MRENLLNEIYLRTKRIITKLIENNSTLNLPMNENNNQTNERILNICVLFQNKQSFHVVFESPDFMKLIARNEVI